MNRGTPRTLLLAALALSTAAAGRAGVLPHYMPGVLNIRDFFVPPEGFYTVLYAPYYHSGEFHNPSGDAVDAVTVPTAQGPATLSVGTSVDALMFAPTFIWATPWRFAGARYAAYAAPTFGNMNLAAAAETQQSLGVSERRGQFALGDLFLQPVWLGWDKPPHGEFSFAYGLYAPLGKFNVGTRTLPSGAELRGPTAGNVGLGYWESQFQGAAAWYPFMDKRTAVTLVGTYEVPGKQRNIDVSPGSYFTLNFAVSQYLPLGGKDLLLEVGPALYGQWQLNSDQGADVRSNALSRVLAAGFQCGVTYVPWQAFLSVRGSDEFKANARIQGQMLSVSIGKKWF